MRQLIFAPAIWIMNHLAYAWKFILMSVLFLTPFAYVTYLQIDAADVQYVFNYKEHEGVDYIKPGFRMLKHAQLMRTYSSAIAGGLTSYKNDFENEKKQIDTLITDFEPIEATYKESFKTAKGEYKTTQRFEEIKKAWADLKKQNFKTAKESYDAHTVFSTLVADWILNYGANFSNLILDPDLDSYWLMDAFVAKLPTITEDLSKSCALSVDYLARKSMTADERLDLSGIYADTEANVSGLLDTDMKTAYDFNNSKAVKTVEPNLKAAVELAAADSRAFRDLLKDKVITVDFGPSKNPEKDAGPALVDPAKMVGDNIKAINSVYDFYEKVAPELDSLIMIRVAQYKLAKRVGYAASIIAAALLIYAFMGFYFSVLTSIGQVADATRKMIAGTTDKFFFDAKDELGKVAESYNEINQALIEARTRINVEKENKLLQESILELLKTVADAADGDLTVRASVSEGALGNVADAINQMLDSWHDLAGEIKKLTHRTEVAISEIRTSAEKMTLGATQQATQLGTASTSVQSMSNSIQIVSETAESAAGAAHRAQESALDGSESVQNVVRGMELLRTNVQAGAKKIKNLGDRSMEITTIVGTIAKISDQTNMLALNAAIEAARAGEHGRGFNVVADEVRKLAERTASATQEIEKLVRSIQAETNESVAAIEQQTQVVEEQSTVVGKAGENLVRIQEVSTESARLISEMSVTAKGQVAGAANVVKSMEHISQIAKQTQSGADQTLSTTREIAQLAGQLTQIVGRFKLKEEAPVVPEVLKRSRAEPRVLQPVGK